MQWSGYVRKHLLHFRGGTRNEVDIHILREITEMLRLVCCVESQ